MGTSQSAVARVESGKADVKMSTVERYAATLGRRVEWRIAPAASPRTVSAGSRLLVAKKSASARSKKAAARKKR